MIKTKLKIDEKKQEYKDFLEKLNDLQNSYGDGNSAKKAYEIIKSIDFKSMIAKVEDPLKVELI